MSKSFVKIIAFAVVAVAFASCGSQKTAEKTPTAESIQTYTPATVAAEAKEWTDVTLNGKVSIGMTSSMVMKMVRGKSLSISLRPLLGIEVGKLYFEGDTVTVVDKYHNAYLRESIGDFMGEYITVATLQSLFLSRPFVVGKGTITPELASLMESTKPDDNRHWQMMPKRSDKRFSYRYEMEENRMLQFVLSLGTDTEYKVYFVNNFMGTDSFSEREKVAEGKLNNAGYYTIPFDIPVQVQENERFAVVVELTTPDSVHPLAIEYAADETTENVDLSDGEGYISIQGDVWENVESKQGCNLCTKAYAK